MNTREEIIVISGINLFEGGPLTIFKDCLAELSSIQYQKYHIIALVHKKSLFHENYPLNISFIEFPLSRKSYLFRLFYEYCYFYFFSRNKNIKLWFSLHDTSPIIKAFKQVVYCHNAVIFKQKSLSDLVFQPKFFLQTLFYKWVYKFNIKSNTYIVVQQNWMRSKFAEYFNLDQSKIIVARPHLNDNSVLKFSKKNTEEFSFFYPSLPRPFKNFEMLCEVAKDLISKNTTNFKFHLTINGSENKYSEWIVKKYGNIKNLNFVGLLNKEEMNDYYKNSNALFFPSKLESWGLPISEAKKYNLPMFLIDLPYTHETLGNYSKSFFFPENNISQLSDALIQFMNGTLTFKEHLETIIQEPKTNNWQELIEIILNE